MEPLKVCDTNCLLLAKIKKANGDWNLVYKEVKQHLKEFNQIDFSSEENNSKTMKYSDPFLTSTGNQSLKKSPFFDFNFKDGMTSFKWDTQNIGIGIQITENNTKAFLKEGPYMFRTVIGDQV